MALDKDLAAAAALADKSHLEPFEGSPVVRTAIEIPNAAGGFQAPMAVNPQQWEHGEEFYVLMHVKVRKVRFDPENPKDENDDSLARVHVLSALSAGFVDETAAAAALAEQEKLLEEARAIGKAERDRLAGQERLVGADGDDSKVNPKATTSKGGKKMEFANDAGPTDLGEKRGKKEVEALLASLSKPQLRDLCARHDIPTTTRTLGGAMVDLLVDVPGIRDEAEALKTS